MKEPQTSPFLRDMILEVVENQLLDNDPPETKQTYEWLMGEGHSSEEAKRLIGCVVVGEMFEILKRQEPFNHARFVEALNKLPELPD